MDGTILKIVETHKHLGVHLSSNNKWSRHIDSIIESASKQISYLRKTIYQFYASEVWDGSTQADANRLEQVQLNAARVVTGLPVFAP